MTLLRELENYNIKDVYRLTSKNMKNPSESLDVLEQIINEFEELREQEMKDKREYFDLRDSLIYNGITDMVGKNYYHLTDEEKKRYEKLMDAEEKMLKILLPTRTVTKVHRLTENEIAERYIPKNLAFQNALRSVEVLRDFY